MRGFYAFTHRALRSDGAVGASGRFWNHPLGVEILKSPADGGPIFGGVRLTDVVPHGVP